MLITPSAMQVCAIITTYSPKSCLVDCVNKILPQVAEIIIIDDGNSDENIEMLASWFSEISKVTLWHQPTNAGIAAALNVGVNIAQKKGYMWMVTLDDDSLPADDMVERLCELYARIEGRRPIGIIGMNRANENLSTAPRARVTSPVWLNKRGIITSGSLFSIQTFLAVGPFREEFFIDSVDYDFCMKARATGFRVIQVQEYGFTHSLGQKESFQFFGFIIETVSHTPNRLYYAFRNSTVLAKEYLLTDPLFACATVLSQFETLFTVLFLQKNKKRKLYAIMMGYAHAIKGRMGKIKTAGGQGCP
jgi:rhamnosyltransferase